MSNDYTGQFLVATDALKDSEFEDSVIYILDHTSEEGAFGLIINHPLELTEGEVIENLNQGYDAEHHPKPAFNGGPVEPQQGFILHPPSSSTHWQGQTRLNDNIALTTSNDLLAAIAQGENIPFYLIALGYSGWDKGQLEQEIADNAWHLIDANPNTILNTAWHLREQACFAHLGIRPEQLSQSYGHA